MGHRPGPAQRLALPPHGARRPPGAPRHLLIGHLAQQRHLGRWWVRAGGLNSVARRRTVASGFQADPAQPLAAVVANGKSLLQSRGRIGSPSPGSLSGITCASVTSRADGTDSSSNVPLGSPPAVEDLGRGREYLFLNCWMGDQASRIPRVVPGPAPVLTTSVSSPSKGMPRLGQTDQAGVLPAPGPARFRRDSQHWHPGG
jgi:hypothetical protein